MRKRILTGAIIAVMLIVLLALRGTIVVDICICTFNVIAIWEMLKVTGYVTDPFLIALSIIYTAAAPFVYQGYFKFSIQSINVVYVMALFCIALLRHRTIDPKHVTYAFTMSMLLSFAFSSMIQLFHKENGLFLFAVACNAAWIADAGAYFVGSFIGKHKMAPEISPKKTIEGAIGGIAVSFIVAIGIVLVYRHFIPGASDISMIAVLIKTPVLAAAGMVGDLMASYIKRAAGIKDFGNLMPGHGGIMDRFDSLLVTTSLVYVSMNLAPIII